MIKVTKSAAYVRTRRRTERDDGMELWRRAAAAVRTYVFLDFSGAGLSQTMLRSSSGRGAYGGRSFVILFRPWPWTYFTGHCSHLLTSIATRRPAAGPNNCRTAATGELSVDSSFARKIDGLAELVNMKR
jgi:hypothetical protein